MLFVRLIIPESSNLSPELFGSPATGSGTYLNGMRFNLAVGIKAK